MKMVKVLIVDDDLSFCKLLKKQIELMGHETVVANSVKQAQKAIKKGDIDIVYLDVQLPDGNGLDLIASLRSAMSSPEVIIVTGQGNPDGAQLALENDAWDYIQKGMDLEAIVAPLEHAVNYRLERQKLQGPQYLEYKGLVGQSQSMKACLETASKAAMTDSNVLITGPTGTGKGLLARGIHANSRRESHPFIVVDCAALTETLAESTLFGHCKGAFTGAVQDQKGLIAQAHQGTLFLDEIGELDLSLQKTFLRCLEEQTFRPIGSPTEQTSQFRLIAATNRNLNQMVEDGQFRQDLLFRLTTFVIELPALKQRIEDIDSIIEFHMDRLCRKMGIENKIMADDVLATLKAYDWPGNVRELVHCLEAAVSGASLEKTLYAKHLPKQVRISVARAAIVPENNDAPEIPGNTQRGDHYPKLKDFRDEMIQKSEEDYLRDLLKQTNGNITEACRVSGLSRSRLFNLRKKYNLA